MCWRNGIVDSLDLSMGLLPLFEVEVGTNTSTHDGPILES
ncbi:MAG: hypothetical protein ACI9P7_001030 [Candidatus Azotimanducaceae bacterium]|jgi:hypothetical protein